MDKVSRPSPASCRVDNAITDRGSIQRAAEFGRLDRTHQRHGELVPRVGSTHVAVQSSRGDFDTDIDSFSGQEIQLIRSCQKSPVLDTEAGDFHSVDTRQTEHAVAVCVSQPGLQR